METGLKEIEDQLPGLEEFLCTVLAKEKLSTAAEKKRKEFVERFEVLKFLSPPLPPRPDGLPKPSEFGNPKRSSIDEIYIAKQREWSRSNAGSRSQSLPKETKPPEAPSIPDQDEYDFVEDASDFGNLRNADQVAVNGDDDLYEEPLGLIDGDVDNFRDDDGSSGTSYESYDEQEADRPPPIYENQDFRVSSSDIALPRVKSKEKKKSKRKSKSKESDGGLPVSKLANVLMVGELHYKEGSVFSKWTKVYSVISDSRFLCYKSEKDSKPIVNFPLLGYLATYFEYDSKLKRNHVIHISHQSGLTLYFSADSKDTADQWMKHLSAMSISKDSSATINNNNEGSTECPKLELSSADSSSNLRKSSSATNLSLTSSEGGSGDGVIQTTHSPSPSPGSESKGTESDMKKSTSGEKRKASKPIIDSIQSMFQRTFGKKDKTLEEMGDVVLDPEALVAGYVNISSELTGCGKKWVQRWCLIKHGMFECYKEAGDEDKEFSFPLAGCSFDRTKDTKRDLAITMSQDGKEKLMIEPKKADQGTWLTYLIRESGFTGKSLSIPGEMNIEDEDIYDVVYEDKPPKAKFSHGSGSGSGGSVSVSSAYGSSAQGGDEYEDTVLARSTPPPLPSVPPPTSRTWKDEGYDETWYENTGFLLQGATEDDSVTDDLYDDVALNTPEPAPAPSAGNDNNESLDDERTNVQRSASDRSPRNKPTLSSESLRSDPGSPRSRSAEQSPRSMSPRSGSRELEIIRVNSTDLQGDTEVVKCHTGPTIEEDMELIQTIHNPILSQLRQQKGGVKKMAYRNSDLEQLEDDVSSAKKTLAQIRKKRAEIRGKKLTCGHPTEKRKYEDELKNLETELEVMQKHKDDLEEKLWDLKLEERKKKTAAERQESLSRKTDLLRKSSFESSLGSSVTRKTSTTTESFSNKDSAGVTTVKTVVSSVSMATRNKSPSSSLSGRATTSSSSLSSTRPNGLSSKLSPSQSPSKLGSSHVTDNFSKTKAKWTAAETEGPTSPPSKTRFTSQTSISANVRMSSAREAAFTSSRVTKAKQKSGSPGSRTTNLSSQTSPSPTRTGARRTENGTKTAGKSTSLQVEKDSGKSDRSPSPKGEKGQVQEKLQLWENISSTSNTSTC